jgi:hypothetical protein
VSRTGNATRAAEHFTSKKKPCPHLDRKRPEYLALLSYLKEKEEKEAQQQQQSRIDVARAETAPRAQSFFASHQMQATAEETLAMGLFCAGIAPAVMDNPRFKAGISAATKMGSSFVIPSAKKMRTTLLTKCDKQITEQVNTQLAGSPYVGTLMSDGWTDNRRRPLMNAVFVNTDGAYFIEAVHAAIDTKTGEYIADFIDRQLVRLGGRDRVAQVLTDSAANCASARRILAGKYPWLFVGPCAVHIMDLFLKDVGDIDQVDKVYKSMKKIVVFFKNHQKPLGLYRAAAKENGGRDLLFPGQTRFASKFIMLERLVECRPVLKQVVASIAWSNFVDEFTKRGKRARAEEGEEGQEKTNAERVQAIVTTIAADP